MMTCLTLVVHAVRRDNDIMTVMWVEVQQQNIEDKVSKSRSCLSWAPVAENIHHLHQSSFSPTEDKPCSAQVKTHNKLTSKSSSYQYVHCL